MVEKKQQVDLANRNIGFHAEKNVVLRAEKNVVLRAENCMVLVAEKCIVIETKKIVMLDSINNYMDNSCFEMVFGDMKKHIDMVEYNQN